MKVDIYKLTRTGKIYLGFQDRNIIPKKGDTIYFCSHYYKVMEAREYIMFVKLIR